SVALILRLLARRTSVKWNLTAGHATKGAIRGQVRNISITGLLMQLPLSYPHGSIIEVILRPSSKDSIPALAQILRIEPPPDGSFLYGACFPSLSDESYYQLREKILTTLQNQGSNGTVKPSGRIPCTPSQPALMTA